MTLFQVPAEETPAESGTLAEEDASSWRYLRRTRGGRSDRDAKAIETW